jgi:hypothetical protein
MSMVVGNAGCVDDRGVRGNKGPVQAGPHPQPQPDLF